MTVEFAARGSHAEIEEGTALAPKFDADGLIPAIAADATDGRPRISPTTNVLESTL